MKKRETTSNLSLYSCVRYVCVSMYHYDCVHICDDGEWVCDGTVLRMRQNLYSYGLLCNFEAYQYIRTSISD